MPLNSLTQFHENEALVHAAQSVAGQLTVWVLAVLLLAWNGVSPLMFGALGLVMVFPKHRHTVLAIAAGGMLIQKLLETSGLNPVQNPVLLCVLLLAVRDAGF